MFYNTLGIFSARNWIRTSTSLRTLRPEHSASTNFAIRATGCKYREECLINDFFEKKFFENHFQEYRKQHHHLYCLIAEKNNSFYPVYQSHFLNALKKHHPS